MEALNAARFIFRNISPIYVPISLIGNLVAFCVFSRKTFKNKSFGFYSRVLLVCDSICAILFLRNILNIGFRIRITDIHPILCTSIQYTFLSVSCMSAYMLSFISFDRMMSIVFPNKFKFLNSRSFQIGVSIAIGLFQFIYFLAYAFNWRYVTNFPLPSSYSAPIARFNATLNITETVFVEIRQIENYTGCHIFDTSLEMTYVTLDLINSSLVPFLLMITFTLIMLFKIFKTRNSTSTLSSQKKNQIKKRDRNFAIVSITLNLVFLIFSFPVVIFRILPGINSLRFQFIVIIITQHLSHANFGSMFFINFLVNKLFKKELLSLFGISNGKLDQIHTSRVVPTNASL
jgi:hypothetical protein